MRIEVVSTGDEVITGSIDDTNASFISRELIEVGLQVSRRHTAPDSLNELMMLFSELSQRDCVVIVTGGLGPTNDDLTTEAAARVAKVPLELNVQWVERMKGWFAMRGRKMANTNLKQAMLPKGSVFINNPVGTACGFVLKIGNALCIFAPGVPKELKIMWENSIKELVLSFVPGQTPRTHLVRLFFMGIGESSMAELINRIELPPKIYIGDRAIYPFIELKVIGRGAKESDVLNTLSKIMESLAPYYLSHDSYDLLEILRSQDIILPPINAVDGLCRGNFLIHLNRLFDDFVTCIALNTNKINSLSEADRAYHLMQLEHLPHENILTILPFFIEAEQGAGVENLKAKLQQKPQFKFHYVLNYHLKFKKSGHPHTIAGRIVLSTVKSIYAPESYGRNREFLSNLACVEIYKLIVNERLIEPEDMMLTVIDSYNGHQQQ